MSNNPSGPYPQQPSQEPYTQYPSDPSSSHQPNSLLMGLYGMIGGLAAAYGSAFLGKVTDINDGIIAFIISILLLIGILWMHYRIERKKGTEEEI